MSSQLDVEAAQAELGFGWYQVRNLALLLLPVFANGLYQPNYVFAAADAEYRCLVPECESNPPQITPGNWGKWALPEGKNARCHRYIPISSSLTDSLTGSAATEPVDSFTAGSEFDLCSADLFSNITERCSKWIYSSNDTIVAEFDLACEDWKRTLVGTVHSIGTFAALTFIGLISDRFGRLAAFIGSATCPAVAGAARAFSGSYTTYVALEFVESMLGSGIYTAGFVLVMESASEKHRVLTSNLVPIVFSLGEATLAAVAWALPGWRALLLAIYLPSTIFIIYCFLLHESPRWLAARGRTQEAAGILLHAAKLNGVTFSPKVMMQLVKDPSPESKSSNHLVTEKKISIAFQVILSKLLMCRLAMCGFWWTTCSFVFYGLTITSVSLLGNEYLNFMLTVLFEIPGYVICVLSMDRFGRKSSLMVAYIFSGAALIAVPLVPRDQGIAQLALTLFGKVWISMAFGGLYIYTSELFPTQARHSLLAASSMIGRIGQILAPQTPLLVLVWPPLPYLTFGVMAVLSAVLMLFAPETRQIPLPDTVAQCEHAHLTRNVHREA